MANEMWGLSDLTYTPFVLNGQDNMKLKFKVYGGSTYIDVTKDGSRQSEVFKTISMIHKEIILDVIKKVQEASPETKFPIVISTFSKQDKKFMTDYILEFSKDNKMVYHIRVIVKDGNFDFVLNGNSGVSIGNEPMSAADRSMYVLRALKSWLTTNSVIQSVVSNKKRDPSTFRNGSRSTSGGRNDNEKAGAVEPTDDNGSQYF